MTLQYGLLSLVSKPHHDHQVWTAHLSVNPIMTLKYGPVSNQ